MLAARLRRMRFIALMVFAAALGCSRGGPPLPNTVPVSGKVVFKGGDVKWLADPPSTVEFESVDQPDLHAYGQIQDDGTFTMTTTKENSQSQGAVPGSHKVRIQPGDAEESPFAAKFQSFETSGITVKVPLEGDLVIEVTK